MCGLLLPKGRCLLSSVTASSKMTVPANVGSGTERTFALICFTDDIIEVSVSFSWGPNGPSFLINPSIGQFPLNIKEFLAITESFSGGLAAIS